MWWTYLEIIFRYPTTGDYFSYSGSISIDFSSVLGSTLFLLVKSTKHWGEGTSRCSCLPQGPFGLYGLPGHHWQEFLHHYVVILLQDNIRTITHIDISAAFVNIPTQVSLSVISISLLIILQFPYKVHIWMSKKDLIDKWLEICITA